MASTGGTARSRAEDATDAATNPARAPAGPTAPGDKAGERESNPVKRALKILGPGLITGASDDDPSGIGTYATAGASLGYAMLWTAPFTFPLMAAVQYVCAKIGLVTGVGLAGVLRRHYSRWLLYPVVAALLIANTINVGADLGAIAAGGNLLTGLPAGPLTVGATAIILALQIWGSYRLIANTFKWLTLVLLAYVVAGILARPDWAEVLRATVLPTVSLDPGYLTVLVAILGTTISPYLFFWQASQEVEEEVSMGRTRLWEREGASDAELTYAAMDVNVGMFAANVVFYFIILTTATTLHEAGQADIRSAADAAQALAPVAGQYASALFAVGLIGAGLLAVPVLTGSAAYAVSEAFGWRYGLDEKPWRARQFYGVIAVATLVGMGLDFVGVNPIDALFWSGVINGFVAAPLLIVIMRVANNREVMGQRTNGIWSNVLGWAATVAMCAAAVGLVVTSWAGG